MQKKRSIPTPLSDANDRLRVQVVEESPISRFRFFQMVMIIASLLWRRLAVRIWPPLGKVEARYGTLANARFIRLSCERMGGIWVKVGQILAMRRDAFSQVFCDELAKLHDHVRGFPGEVARQIIEAELGGPIEQFFDQFDTTPLAAASIGQTHEARLRQKGIRVVIKVQRPEIEKAFRSDLRFLKGVIYIIDVLHVLESGRWDEMLWELDKTFSEELDYRLEASSISRMRKLLRHQKVYAPRVFERYCTRRVLVMEFIEGVFMSEYIHVAQKHPERIRAWTQKNNVSPKRVGKRLYQSHLQQVFEDNLYHCDLHPGNIVLLRNDRFALIDFGSIASFEKSFLEKYSLMFRAIATRDFTKVVDIMLITSPALPDKDLTDLRAELLREMRAWDSKTSIKNIPYHEKSLTTAMASLAEILGKYEVPPAWEFLRLQRAEITLDSSLALLLPDVNYVKLARSYMEKSQRRAFATVRTKASRLQFMSTLTTLLSLPQRMGENLLFDAEWLRKRAMSFEGTMTKAAAVGKLVLSFLIRAAVVGGVVLVVGFVYRQLHTHPKQLEGTFTGGVADRVISLRHDVRLFLLIALFYACVLFVRIQRRLAERRSNNTTPIR